MSMEYTEVILSVSGVMLGALLSVIVYFLRVLHIDFRSMMKRIEELNNRMTVSEEKGRSGHTLHSTLLEQHERRLAKLENKVFD